MSGTIKTNIVEIFENRENVNYTAKVVLNKEIEENDKTVKDQGNNLPAIIKKENIVTKIKNSKLAEVFKNLGSKISNIFSKNKKDEK